MGYRYLLRSFGVKIDKPTIKFGDNLASIKSTTEAESPLNQRHIGISYHTARECEAADITRGRWVCSKENRADGGTKALSRQAHHELYKDGGAIFTIKK